MPLRIRRGPDSDFTLDGETRRFGNGEPVFNTTNNTLHIGRGDDSDPAVIGGAVSSAEVLAIVDTRNYQDSDEVAAITNTRISANTDILRDGDVTLTGSNITAINIDGTNRSIGGGGWELITERTLDSDSRVTSLDFTTGWDFSTFRDIRLEVVNANWITDQAVPYVMTLQSSGAERTEATPSGGFRWQLDTARAAAAANRDLIMTNNQLFTHFVPLSPLNDSDRWIGKAANVNGPQGYAQFTMRGFTGNSAVVSAEGFGFDATNSSSRMNLVGSFSGFTASQIGGLRIFVSSSFQSVTGDPFFATSSAPSAFTNRSEFYGTFILYGIRR